MPVPLVAGMSKEFPSPRFQDSSRGCLKVSPIPKARLFRHILETQSAQIVIEMYGCGRRHGFEVVGVDQEDIEEPVVAVIEKSYSGTRVLDHVGLLEFSKDSRR